MSGQPSHPAAGSQALPTVQVAVASAMLAAGVQAILAAHGIRSAPDRDRPEADVLIVDDAWLADPDALGGHPALVALGSGVWATLLPDLSAGGWAALGADATPAELLAGVLGAAAGLAVLPPALLPPPTPETPADDLQDDDPASVPPGDVILTPRERDVLALLAEGLSNKRAARDLGVSESTVKFHVQALYSKLGVQSRAGAVARGISLGLVSV
ncbi:response regulator transcription factor [Deinococcus aquaticus]|uniref:Response regulator transcription factor n=1 Tax=Deinococcus aquaticus TaxID=328692 RepID=A0ABY7V081_9DEIO|nr:response regulator transcription factor [Deinococcus aquaticus]WDA58510.1 response regulator transcription factor [Deinococcus aquaticus]